MDMHPEANIRAEINRAKVCRQLFRLRTPLERQEETLILRCQAWLIWQQANLPV
jgi:hypothetical protein